MIDFGIILLIGMLTSLHCVGMCGVVVLAYSTQPQPESPVAYKVKEIAYHAAYNSGRIFSYVLLGAIVGIAGMTIGWIQQAGEYFSIISGAIMVMAGIAMLGIIPLPTNISLSGSSNVATKFHASLLRKKTMGSKFSLGFLTPLLPCGILYAMLAKAATSGNAINGALTMGSFALGMTPALLLLGTLSSFFSSRVRKRAERLAAVMIIFMGIILMFRGFHVPYLGWLSGETKCPKCAS